MTLQIKQLELPPIGTNCWIVSSSDSDEWVVIDAPLSAWEGFKEQLDGRPLNKAHLLMTHGHWDHTLDGCYFNEHSAFTAYAGKADAELYEQPESMSRFALPGLHMKPMRIDRWVKQGDTLNLLGETVEVREVPGHSPGSVLFWFRQSGCAFSGDALFQGGVGRTDFPGCSYEELEKSIRQQIYTLPAETRILPGHGPETSVGGEVRSNPFVRLPG